jgi:hypothetical protein
VLLVLLVGTLLALAVVRDSATGPWKERAKIVQALILLGLVWYAVATVLRLRRTSGAVLLDLPHPWPVIRVLAVLVAVGGSAVAIFCFAFLPEGLEAALAQVLGGLLLLSGALLCITGALSRLRFTEHGVFAPLSYIAWEDVAAYRWQGKDGRKLRLVPRRWLPLFGYGALPLLIPAGQKGAVEDVLARHVAAVTAAAR